ncbi:hypothetical protein SRHO_G00294760 [Serrasalmus rhombeus]
MKPHVKHIKCYTRLIKPVKDVGGRLLPAAVSVEVSGRPAAAVSEGPALCPHGDPLFRLHYLGTEKIYSLDMEQAEDAIHRLLENSPAVSSLRKDHALVVRQRYLEVKEVSTGRQMPGQVQLQCRVFWCRRPERARDITSCLALSFQRALKDWQEGEGVANESQPIREQEVKSPAHPADSGSGDWRRSSMSHIPLREMMRRTISD